MEPAWNCWCYPHHPCRYTWFHISYSHAPPTPFFSFHMWSGSHVKSCHSSIPVMLKSAGFCVMYGNKRGVWARSDTLPPTRHSLNAYESQVESCRLAWCVCARMRWCFLIHKTFLLLCLSVVWSVCQWFNCIGSIKKDAWSGGSILHSWLR